MELSVSTPIHLNKVGLMPDYVEDPGKANDSFY